MSFKYSLIHLRSSIKKRWPLYLSSIVTLSGISFIILLFYLLFANFIGSVEKMRLGSKATLFLEKSLEEPKVKRVFKGLYGKPYTKRLNLNTPSDLIDEYFSGKNLDKDYIEQNSLLPYSIELVLVDGYSTKAVDDVLQDINKIEGVEEVVFAKSLWNQSVKLQKIAYSFFMSIILLLIFGGLFLIGNLVNSSMTWKREEIKIYKLIGADNSFIFIPYFFEAIIMSLVASLLSLGALYLVFKANALVLSEFFSVWLSKSQLNFIGFKEISIYLVLFVLSVVLASYLSARKIAKAV